MILAAIEPNFDKGQLDIRFYTLDNKCIAEFKGVEYRAVDNLVKTLAKQHDDRIYNFTYDGFYELGVDK